MTAPTEHILRSIARVAARNAFRRAQTADAQLLDEARMTDRFSCTDAEMLVRLRAELDRVEGKSGRSCDRSTSQIHQELMKESTMSTPARKHIAKAIYFITWVVAITVLWQAVRFCQGHVGAIALDEIIALTNQMWGADREAVSTEVVSLSLHMAMIPYFQAIYFIGGIAAWCGSAGIVIISGLSFGQIIEFGFEKFKAVRHTPIAG